MRNTYKLVNSVNPRTDGVVFPDYDTAQRCDMQKAVALYDPDLNQLALLTRDGDSTTIKFTAMLKNTSYRPSLIAIPRGGQTNYFFGTEQTDDVTPSTGRRPIARVTEGNVMEAVNGKLKELLKVCYCGVEIGTYNPSLDEYDLPAELDDSRFEVWEYEHDDDKQYLDVDADTLDSNTKLLFDTIAKRKRKQVALDNTMNSTSREDYIPVSESVSVDNWLHDMYNSITPTAPTNLIEDTIKYLKETNQ